MARSAGTGDELPYWLALNRVPGLHPRMALDLVEAAGSPRALARAARAGGTPPEHALTPRQLRELAAPDWSAVATDVAWLEGPNRSLLTWGCESYPGPLKEIPDPPLVLFVEGDASTLQRHQVAMVGSRHATPAGREIAAELAADLVGAGWSVTSGLARGIDAAAHRGALAAGGPTVAVAAHGLDIVYPREHRTLAHEIAACGALVSEFALGVAPRPAHFPRRNRLISGMSAGVVVVEAAHRSGSLITARLAGEQGREVFAVPGATRNPVARGCHRLLRDGAKLVESVEDVLEELRHYGVERPAPGRSGEQASPKGAHSPSSLASDPDARKLLASLDFDATSFDTVVDRTGLTPAAVSSMLLALELQGHVRSAPGGMYALVGKRP